jgi:UMP-CMP kinase
VCLSPTPHTPRQLKLIINTSRLGKGTQCGILVEEFNFSHLSAGDLLRAEQDRPDSQYGVLIRTCIREGKIVPMEVTVKLLENAMDAVLQSKSGLGWENGKGRFLIDGFPRKMDQALKFEEEVRSQPSWGLILWVASQALH